MKILGVISIVAIALCLFCGLWMKYGKYDPAEKDANFHGILSIVTILLCLVTIVLYMIKM